MRPAGTIRISSSSTKSVKPLGFSNGIALLTLKKPPPLVPSSLIASCEATGPTASVWVPPAIVWKAWEPSRVWTTPWETRTSAARSESGSRM